VTNSRSAGEAERPYFDSVVSKQGSFPKPTNYPLLPKPTHLICSYQTLMALSRPGTTVDFDLPPPYTVLVHHPRMIRIQGRRGRLAPPPSLPLDSWEGVIDLIPLKDTSPEGAVDRANLRGAFKHSTLNVFSGDGVCKKRYSIFNLGPSSFL
jgi:hypothetical protein